MARCFCPCHTHPGTYPPPCGVCGHDTRKGRMVGGYRDGWEPNEKQEPYKEGYMLAVDQIAKLTAENREYRSLLECTQFALEWLIMYHVIEDGGADWKSKFDGSAFFACDCSESGGYMEYDTNAYIHTERCASVFEDSLTALHDQIKAALSRPPRRAATDGEGVGE